MIGYTRITKDQFYRAGGFSNSRLARVMKGRAWTYWERWS